MNIKATSDFLSYYDKIKHRTERLFAFIPEDKLEWRYKEGMFSIGDQIRHLANIERYMYGETVQHKASRYQGCGTEYAEGLDRVVDYYRLKYQESRAIFSTLSNADLGKKCRTPANIEITTWKWLRAMIEHEVHHRAQIYLYLTMFNVNVPQLFGLTSEEVIEKSKQD